MFKSRFFNLILTVLVPVVTLAGLPPGEGKECYLIDYKQSNEHITLKTNEGYIKLTAWTFNTFQVAFSPDSVFAVPSDAIVSKPVSGQLLVVDLHEHINLRLGTSTITIQKNPFILTFRTGNNHKETVMLSGPFVMDDGTGLSIHLEPKEKITGGGARAIPMDRRGYKLKLENEPHWGYTWGEENLNYSVPVFISTRKFLVFYDSPQRATADIGHTKANIFRLHSPQKNFSMWFVSGNDYKSLLQEYTQLTGTQPLPPIWALGNLQSRFGYKSQTQTINVADSMLMAGFPLDAVILDLYWFGKGLGDFRMGNLTWEPDNWPTPEKMINQLKQKGVKTILITEPFFLTNSANYSEADKQGLFGKTKQGESFVIDEFWFGPASLIDVFNPKATKWFWQKHVPLKEQGVAGWWGDLGEPEKHPSGIYYSKGSSDQVHNIYGHYWSKLLSDAYAEHYPNERLFFLNRAGYAGSQRYSVFPWSGDVSRSWDGFKAQMPIMLGMSLSGIPYMHSDLGGFAAGEMDDELFTRWLQFGVFNPVYRPHGETHPSEPIYYSKQAQSVIRDFIKLRYRLMPYLYTMAWQQTTSGFPLARPLMYEHPDDENLVDIFDTYYWGDNFLVAPILESGITERKVWLPDGDWFHFFTNQTYTGKKWHQVPTTFSDIPVFVKAGSFIPMVNSISSTDYYTTDTLYVRYYHHQNVAKASGIMFHDDGKDAKSLDNGKFELLKFNSDFAGSRLSISFTKEGRIDDARTGSRHIILEVHNLNKMPKKVAVKKKKQRFNYNKQSGTLSLPFNWNGEPVNIIIQ